MNTSLLNIARIGALRLSGVVLQSLILMLVGRLAGPAGVGALQLFLTWTCTLGEMAAAGLPTQAMRMLSNRSSRRSLALAYLLRSIIRMSGLWLLIMSVAILLYSMGVLSAVQQIGWIAIAVFAFALQRIASESLKAFQRTDFSVFVESAIAPLIAGLLLGLSHLLGHSLDADAIVVCFSLGFIASATILVMKLLSMLGYQLPSRKRLPVIKWQDHAPFWVTALVSIGFLNFPFIILPYFSGLEEIGAFALAFKLLNICTTILLLLGSIYGPKFARMAHEGDWVATQSLLRSTQRLSLMLFVPLVLLLGVLFPYIHSFFGESFESGHMILLVLSVGQLVNAATGLSGQLLNMNGAGTLEMKAQVLGLLLASALAPIAGAYWGAMGIALVYSISIAAKSIASLWYANRLLNPRLSLAV